MFGLGFQELLIVLVIILILFGAKRLPELAGGMGKAIKAFKKASFEPDDTETAHNVRNTLNNDDGIVTEAQRSNER